MQRVYNLNMAEWSEEIPTTQEEEIPTTQEEEIPTTMEEELEVIKCARKEHDDALTHINFIDSQYNENNAVREELMLLNKDTEVYKLIGPVLVKQDLVEVKYNIDKRIEYISYEYQKADDYLSAVKAKLDELQDALISKRIDLVNMKLKDVE